MIVLTKKKNIIFSLAKSFWSLMLLFKGERDGPKTFG